MDLGNFGTLLGALTGFVAVMLALSLVSTALVQTVHTLLHLRGRAELAALETQNLGVGRATLEALMQYPTGGVESSPLPARWVAQALRWIRGPQRQRLTREQYAAVLPKGNYEEFLVLARERFTSAVRPLAVVGSGLVAFSMQVSATQLLADLSTDPDLRMRAMELSGNGLSAVRQLALIDIQFCQDLSFYYSAGAVNSSHVVGVLITTVLLSFGAPFWYEQLRALSAIGLRSKQPAPTKKPA